MKILVQFPTRGRINQFSRALHRWQNTRTTDAVHFNIIIDRDDNVMNKASVLSSIQQWGNLTINIIEPCGKIGAINYGLGEASRKYDIIVLASDDMMPVDMGWDERIIAEMYKHYPEKDGVLWFYDGHTKDLNTLSILGTEYFRRFGYIYHPSYKGLWCDNEFMDVAQMLGKQTFIPDCIIKHEHPIWTNRHGDQLNIRDNNNYDHDKQNYERRKQHQFDIVILTDSDTTEPSGDVQQVDSKPEQANPKRRGRRPRSVVQP